MDQNLILYDEQFLKTAHEVIEKAQRSILISTFKAEICTKPRGRQLAKFFSVLSAKAQLNIDVRLLTNQVSPRGTIPITNLNAIQILQRGKVKVRCLRGERICHAKLLLVDTFYVILGSHNLSVKSCHSNFEVSYFFKDLFLAEQLVRLYNSVWEQAFRP